MHGGGASGGRDQQSVVREGGSTDRGRAVRFEPVVKLILVPSRHDLGDARLSEELWWSEDDYLQFRYGTRVVDSYPIGEVLSCVVAALLLSLLPIAI